MVLEANGYCFVCGNLNPMGLGLRLGKADGQAECRYRARPEHQGFAGIVHGGIIFSLLDETMAYAVASTGAWAITAKVEIRYLRPLQVGEEVEVRATVVADRGRLIECEAQARNREGQPIGTARATFTATERQGS